MSDEDKLGDALGLPTPAEREFRPVIVPENPQEDGERARSNLYEMMTKTADAVDALMQIAAVSQHPRSFEALSLLVKSNLEAARDLVDLEKKKLEVKKLRGDTANEIDGDVFTGSAILTQLKNNVSK